MFVFPLHSQYTDWSISPVAGNQKLHLACPTYHDTRQGMLFSTILPFFLFLFLAQASIICPLSLNTFSNSALPLELYDEKCLQIHLPHSSSHYVDFPQFTWDITNDTQWWGRKNSGLRKCPSTFGYYSFLKCWRWNPGAPHICRQVLPLSNSLCQSQFYPEFPLSNDHFYPIETFFLQKSQLTWVIHLLRTTFLKIYGSKIYLYMYLFTYLGAQGGAQVCAHLGLCTLNACTSPQRLEEELRSQMVFSHHVGD